MRDYNKGKKYIILKKSKYDGIKILSNPGLFISMGSNGIVKEFNSKKEVKSYREKLFKKYPNDWIYIYTVHTYCYFPVLQTIKHILNGFKQ